MATWIWVNIGSDNGLLPDGTKPLSGASILRHIDGIFVTDCIKWQLSVLSATKISSIWFENISPECIPVNIVKYSAEQSYNTVCHFGGPGGRFKNTYELLTLRALKFSYANKIHIFQCMGKIFCVEFQRYPLKFHTKYLTHTLKDMILMQFWNFKSS